MEINLSCRDFEHFVEPQLEVFGRRSGTIKIDATPAETTTLKFEFDVVIFWVCVGNAYRLAGTQGKQVSAV